MSETGPRTLASEVARHFKGTPGERIDAARRAGRICLDLYLAAHPGTTEEEARRILRANKHRGRRRSKVMEDP